MMERDKKKLNFLILESSKIVAARLVDLIMHFEETNEILYAPTFDKPINLLLSNKVDIILCSIALTDENVARLNELRCICRPFYFIVLSNSVQEECSNKHPNLTVDAFFVISEVVEKLPDIISEASFALTRQALAINLNANTLSAGKT
jgi:DNA-binding NarL/FixJ family response regulator